MMVEVEKEEEGVPDPTSHPTRVKNKYKLRQNAFKTEWEHFIRVYRLDEKC